MRAVNVDQNKWTKIIKNKEYNYHLLWECGEILNISQKDVIMYPMRHAIVDEYPIFISQGIITNDFFSNIKKIEFGGYFGEGILFLENNIQSIMRYYLDFLEKSAFINRDMYILFFLDIDKNYCSLIAQILEKQHYNRVTNYTPIIELQKPVSNLWKALKDGTRRAVQQAIKRGSTFEENTTSEGVKWLCEIMEEYDLGIMSNPHVLQPMLEKGMDLKVLNLFFTKVDSNVAAGVAILRCRNVIGYTLGGMKKKYNVYRPSNLLQWKIIEWANNSGYSQYNMVWAPPPGHPEYSITRFKLGFGAYLKEVPIYFKKVI
jgi:hypothetical protein